MRKSKYDKKSSFFQISGKGCLIAILLIVIGGIIGFIVGLILFSKNIFPQWKQYDIDTDDINIQEILFIDYDTSSQDIIFVKTPEGHIYSYAQAGTSWQKIDDYPLDIESKSCNNYWLYPFIVPSILDTEGFMSEGAFSIYTKCYLLLNDGRLQLWLYESNAIDAAKIIITSTILGIIISGLIGAVIYKKHFILEYSGEKNANHNDRLWSE